MSEKKIPYGKFLSAETLGQAIRFRRKELKMTQERLGGLCNLGTRFISEVERGKQTAELGKVLRLLMALGLDISVQPRKFGR